MSASDAISPTAHYTGYVWARNGLSYPELSTLEGRVLFESFRPLQMVSSALGGASLERYLLARHRAIDVLLERAIEQHGITQVIEVASGLSPRGLRFSSRYGDALSYIEADLPAMAARKRAALERIGTGGRPHRVADFDALEEEGPTGIAAVAAELAPERGLAIITEGLLGYLPSHAVTALWQRFARTLTGFATGRYISDLHIGGVQTAQVRLFRVLLSAFVRGRVHLHFHDRAQAVAALKSAGFEAAEVHRAADLAADVQGPGSGLVHIIEASIR